MEFISALIAVKDIEKSKKFYYDILGLDVISDFGANVVLRGGIALQTADTLEIFINKNEDEIVYENNACELYFEEDDIEAFINKLSSIEYIKYIHPLIEHSWGQRVVRFYDLDGHIIEVGESLKVVVRRFFNSGLSVEQTAMRMDVSEEYIKQLINENGKI
ncbi:MAG: glyoxalase [Eubacteriaceae bacterium]|nr:glyoxalase [Eubacteriaceae bacterium]